MSSSLVYLGSTPASSATVSQDLSDMGINLIRSNAGLLHLSGVREFTHPNYENYLRDFGLGTKSLIENKPMESAGGRTFFKHTLKDRPSFVQDPTVVFKYQPAKSPEFIEDLKAKYNVQECSAGGKPAYSIRMSPARYRALTKDQPHLIREVDVSVNTLNIDGASTYYYLHALFHTVARIHQYPLISPGSSNFTEALTKSTKYLQANFTPSANTAGYAVLKSNAKTYSVMMNLPSPFATHNYIVTSAANIPNNSGLIFPFLDLLAKDDHSTVPDLLHNILFPLLGNSSVDAEIKYQELIRGWSNLKITKWGRELAHMYTGLKLAFDAGAGYSALAGPQGLYAGFILSGTYFHVTIEGRVVKPQPFGTLQTDFTSALPHVASLSDIYDLIIFTDPMDRGTRRAAVTKMYDVALDLRVRGYNATDRERILELAKKLSFVHDQYLPVNATNIARVLNAMSSGLGEDMFPLHPDAIFSQSRNHRLLSAFGSTAPSFVVRGGRKLELSGTFGYQNVIKGGKKTDVNVTKMTAMMKKWSDACNDLDTVMSERAVWSSVGTQIGNTGSSRSIIREYEGAMGIEVLGALRALCKITMNSSTHQVGVSVTKRKAEEDLNEKLKRAREDLDDV